jgi:hypothetical protein
MIGHNGGPGVEGGTSWRRHCWRAAREALLPTLPIEVVRTRVKRAQDLGLDYRTYASVRAQTGHDVVAFLFSSNALRVDARVPRMAAGRAEKLALVRAGRIGLAVTGLEPALLAGANPELDRADRAPLHLAGWGEARRQIQAVLRGLPPDRVLLVGDLALEREWCAAGRLAYYLPAERYFAP